MDRVSAIIASVLLIILVSVLLPALKYIPLACVAGILMNVSYRMLETDELKRIFKQSKGQFLVVIVVAVISIVQDATIGIAVGWIISMLRTCTLLSKSNTKVVVRQGSSVITAFYTDIVLTDKVMPPFIFKKKAVLETPDSIQESFVFNPVQAPRSKQAKPEVLPNEWEGCSSSSGTELDSRASYGPVGESTWEEVRELGVTKEDSKYSLVVHYVMQGQLSFITCSTHVKRLANTQSDIVLIDLSDISSVDLDGQV